MLPRFCAVCLVLAVLAGGGCLLVYQQTFHFGPDAEDPSPKGLQPRAEEDTAIDLKSKPLERIPVGTVVGQTPPAGWSNLVLIAVPTLVPEDELRAPAIAAYYARMFKLTILAKVAAQETQGKKRCYLERVARGFAMTIAGQEKIVSSKDMQGGDPGMWGKKIIDENEKILDEDVRQVARTSTMLIFDAQAVMLRGNDHVNMVMRHALLVDPQTGRLYTLVWLLTKNYQAGEEALQLLPEGMWEKRYLSVKPDQFNFLGIPTRGAFALRQVPPGTPIAWTPPLHAAGTVKTFDEETVRRAEQTLRAAALQAACK